jgi:hypothetical protein
MASVREKLRQFIEDPLGTAIQLAVYLILLGVGVYILVLAARWALGFVGSALR